MSAQSLREDEQQPLDSVESPGKRLRIARQAKGMSQDDVASHLHLNRSIIQALESDDHDRLPIGYATKATTSDSNGYAGTPGDAYVRH